MRQVLTWFSREFQMHPQAKLKGAPGFLIAAVVVLLIAAEALSFRWTHRFALFLTGDELDAMALAIVMSVGKTALGIVAVGYLRSGQRAALHTYVGLVILLSISASLGNMGRLEQHAYTAALTENRTYQRLTEERLRINELFEAAQTKEARNAKSKYVAVRNEASVLWKKGDTLPDGTIAATSLTATAFYAAKLGELDAQLGVIESSPEMAAHGNPFLRAGEILGVSAAGAIKTFYDLLVSVILDLYAPLCLWLLGLGMQRNTQVSTTTLSTPKPAPKAEPVIEELASEPSLSIGEGSRPKLEVIKKERAPRKPKIERTTTPDEDYVQARAAIAEGRLKPSVRAVGSFVRRGTDWTREALKRMCDEGLIHESYSSAGKLAGYRLSEAA